jgi:hypothetical protein
VSVTHYGSTSLARIAAYVHEGLGTDRASLAALLATYSRANTRAFNAWYALTGDRAKAPSKAAEIARLAREGRPPYEPSNALLSDVALLRGNVNAPSPAVLESIAHITSSAVLAHLEFIRRTSPRTASGGGHK